jgi:transcriptional regulator with XRE-family HTH domain
VADEVKPIDHAVMPGEQLRMAREGQGMSLDEAARITCIGMSYLEALESDRYELLPSPAYVKGIIRSYARILGIQPDALIASYEQGAEPEKTDDEQTGRSGAAHGKKPWLLLLIIGVIICIGYMLAQRDTSHDQPSTSTGQIMSVAVPVQGILPPRSSHVRPTTLLPVPVPVPSREEVREDTTPTAGNKKAVLKVKVIHECFFTITIDDAPPQQYDLKSGDQIEWMGERYFALEMTNAGAIEAELNGKALPPLGKSGDAATVVITADGQIE